MAALADISADTDPTRKAAEMGMDWKEVERLAGRSEYRILAECGSLVSEVANELKIQNPLDSAR